MTMAQHKTVVSPLLRQWRYYSLALSHGCGYHYHGDGGAPMSPSSLIWRQLCGRRESNFADNFFIIIQTRWQFQFAVIPFVINISLQTFAHAMTAQLSCHVQNFAAICPSKLEWQQNKMGIFMHMPGRSHDLLTFKRSILTYIWKQG